MILVSSAALGAAGAVVTSAAAIFAMEVIFVMVFGPLVLVKFDVDTGNAREPIQRPALTSPMPKRVYRAAALTHPETNTPLGNAMAGVPPAPSRTPGL